MKMNRLFALLIVVFSTTCLIGCNSNDTQSTSSMSESKEGKPNAKADPSPGLDRVTLLLNWYPEAEHGGYYAALVHKIFEKYGLDVEIKPGGKTTVVAQELTIGRIEFGIGNADDVVLAREQDAPLVAIMAPMQVGPRCIMVREDSGITSFEQLANITLQIDPARPYIPFMKSKGLLNDNVKTVPYFGTVAQLVSDKRTAQQAYSFSEPFMAEQEGVAVRKLMMSDLGYNPYASVLIATEEFIQKKPDVAKRMVAASIEGWIDYLERPEETNAYILKQNKQGMTAKALEYGVANLKELCVPPGFAAKDLGAMDPDRWSTLVSQLRDVKMIEGKVKPEQCFRTDLLPPNAELPEK